MKLMSLPILDGGDVNFLLFFSFFSKKNFGDGCCPKYMYMVQTYIYVSII